MPRACRVEGARRRRRLAAPRELEGRRGRRLPELGGRGSWSRGLFADAQPAARAFRRRRAARALARTAAPQARARARSQRLRAERAPGGLGWRECDVARIVVAGSAGSLRGTRGRRPQRERRRRRLSWKLGVPPRPAAGLRAEPRQRAAARVVRRPVRRQARTVARGPAVPRQERPARAGAAPAARADRRRRESPRGALGAALAPRVPEPLALPAARGPRASEAGPRRRGRLPARRLARGAAQEVRRGNAAAEAGAGPGDARRVLRAAARRGVAAALRSPRKARGRDGPGRRAGAPRHRGRAQARPVGREAAKAEARRRARSGPRAAVVLDPLRLGAARRGVAGRRLCGGVGGVCCPRRARPRAEAAPRARARLGGVDVSPAAAIRRGGE